MYLHIQRAPPKFADGMYYKTLQDKNDIWKIGTSIPKEKRAIIVLLESFECNAKAEKAASELTAANVNKETTWLS